jgi:hypothetical protein
MSADTPTIRTDAVAGTACSHCVVSGEEPVAVAVSDAGHEVPS